jgi:putative transcriptional regulator
MSINNTWSFEQEKNKPLSGGKLILAEPFLYDGNFKRSVVLVCEHNDAGTVGLMINRPFKVNLTDVLPDFPDFDARIFLGGPVGTDSLQFIHTIGDKIAGGIRLTEGIYWGGDFGTLKILIETNQIKNTDVHFFIGYSGWDKGQLDSELRENSWIIAEAKHEYLFSNQPLTIWNKIMNDLGGIYKTMSQYPENPILN